MKIYAVIAILTLMPAFGGAAAQEFGPETINTASLTTVAPKHTAKTSKEPDPAIIRLQVLLDRAGASPGVIDGFYGDNVSKAIAGFEAMNHLAVDGKLDPDVIARLETDAPITQTYLVTPEDATGLVDHIPDDYGEKAKMKSMGYTSVAERLSERFHMAIGLLNKLNPGSDFAPGKTVLVVAPGPPKEGHAKRIEINKKTSQVLAYDESGALLAVYPATIGSEDNPSPSGTHKVKGVARMPVYRYNPKLNFKQGKNNKILTIPKGPNGPVGSVWIDLDKPTYGIHGTPDPELIDKGQSHGCVRLTNWDAEELAGMVKPSVVVHFNN
ncbi:L,D-transpeptidase family protein [Rhizobium leucaenae]|uniref:Lipoprotein-anchoring transpeptidase ErfK/SrfK n=1 Tax=Rhizobium leucaenae TaxID=29450 RepID=A0A7W6ZVB2_9HYPH|nr:L,D-transpeptidase [Rhizobium leucaenae]MBB4569255.1 lipoprotein-anchoring transpeptidase ErfK/SrfK [Rhizobium leucaenae]MBB6302707.1 lipoprotein-anchoring transpeptidase ErfK/SrfK [Rhizobium leucaenae]